MNHKTISLVLPAVFTISISMPIYAQELSGNGQDAKQLVQEASKLAKEQEYNAASEKLARAVEIDPGSADAHQALGKVLMDKNDYEAAAAQLNRALILRPEDAETWGSLGVCYHCLGKLAEGIACFRRALELDPYISNNKIVNDMLPIMERSAKVTGLGASPCNDGADDYLGDATRFRIARWDSNRMPIKILIKDGTAVPGFKADYLTYLKQSFSDWADACDGKIKFDYITDEQQPDIVCSWTDDRLHSLSPAEGGQAVLTGDNQGLAAVELKLGTMTTQTSQASPISEVDAHRACLHLVGHALGIIGHSGNPKDIMCANGTAAQAPSLSAHDKNTLTHLYALDDSIVAQYALDPTVPPISGDPPCQEVRCEILKCRAADAISSKNYKDAVDLLDEALALAPHNLSVANEIVLAYTDLAKQAISASATQLADQYFKKAEKCAEPFSSGPALDHFVHSPLKGSLISCLQQYLALLESQNRKNEAHIVLSHIRSLEQ